MSTFETGNCLEQPTGITCLRCQFVNPRREPLCLACGITLPRETARGDGDGSTGRLRRICSRVEQLRTGLLTTDQFRIWIENQLDILNRDGEAIVQFLQENNYWQQSEEEVAVGLAGVEAYAEGAAELWQYTQDLDPSHLDRGVDTLYRANENIIDAMRLNRERREKLAEEYDVLNDASEQIEYEMTRIQPLEVAAM